MDGLHADWFYSNKGERQGPVSFEELKTLAARGTLDAARDLAWTEGMEDWMPSGQVPGLFAGNPAGSGEAFNPYAAPFTASEDLLAPITSAGVSDITPGTYSMEVFPVLGRSMELTNRSFGTILGIGVVYFILTMVIGMGFEF